MSRFPQVLATVEDHLKGAQPEHPVYYFSPETLQRTARSFSDGFDGLVSYAVKANPEPAVLENLVAAGVAAFDVASPAEIALGREIAPGAALHYNNPVRSRAEIAAAVAAGVASYSVDGMGELSKLVEQLPRGVEISVRLALPVEGAAYHFGSKFGEGRQGAAELLRAVADAGFSPAMTFHPGTQCADPTAWAHYIESCASVARAAGVRLTRLNVGGGFAVDRGRGTADLVAAFEAIHAARAAAFGPDAPALVCEPGRAMVADAFTLALQVKAERACGGLFLNDGIYGALAEIPLMGMVSRLRVVSPGGEIRSAPPRGRVLFGPTCDSVDQLPEPVDLPGDIAEGDYILIEGMGAYTTATATRFNGYGAHEIVTVHRGGHRRTAG